MMLLQPALSHQFNVTEKQVTSVQARKLVIVDCLNLCYGDKNKTEFIHEQQRPLDTKLKMFGTIYI